MDTKSVQHAGESFDMHVAGRVGRRRSGQVREANQTNRDLYVHA